MRAWRVHEPGPPEEALVLDDDVPTPEPAAGEVVVEVDACALNFADSLLCRGSYQERPDPPFVPGLEVVGRVAAVPDGVAGISTGDRVVGLTALPHGGLATTCRTHAAATFPLPATIDDERGAAMLVTYQTAWVGLHRRVGLRPDDVVLVHGAAGGTGSAFVQLASAAGAHVIATAGGAEKVERARALGAAVGIDNRTDDVAAAVLEHTGGRGADIVVDTVGGDLFDASTRCVAWEGRILVVGFAGGRIAEARTNHVMVKNYSVVGMHWPRYRIADPQVLADAHRGLVDMVSTGALVLPEVEVLAFEAAADGLRRLAAGATVGKLVVRVS